MTKIRIGQLVTRRPNSDRYSITTDKSLCLVENTKKGIFNNEIEVLVVAHAEGEEFHGWVDTGEFIPCTYAEFIKKVS